MRKIAQQFFIMNPVGGLLLIFPNTYKWKQHVKVIQFLSTVARFISTKHWKAKVDLLLVP